MKIVTRQKNIPQGSVITKDFETIHYCDTFKGRLFTADNIDMITTDILTVPGWVSKLMALRNRLVSIIGLKTGNVGNIVNTGQYVVGSKAGYFRVFDRNDNEIILGEDDKHLDFRASVLVDKENKFVYLNTVVHFHNLFGRLYFIPVKPFHVLILRTLMKSYIRRKSIIKKS